MTISITPSGSALITTALLIATTSLSFADLPLTGGHTSTNQSGTAAFSQPAANLSLMDRVDFSVGNSFFRNAWVIAPSSTAARDGLGPLFNTNSCQACHIRDGRGHAPTDRDDSAVSMLIRLSVKPLTANKIAHQERYGPIAEPSYGGQFQDHAIPSVAKEGRILVNWQTEIFTYPDNSKITLRRPQWSLDDLAYGELNPNVEMSARIAPPMIGLGLLEQVTEADILAREDVNDDNADGISGKANRVWDVRTQTTKLGRFGWKAGMPSLEQQNASAFNGDLGITSELFLTDDCTATQTDCLNAINGDSGSEKELQVDVLTAVTFYSRHLAVPTQRFTNPTKVNAGKTLFYEVGCESCHRATLSTPINLELPALSRQTFHPFTDLLLHDMGEDLADHRAEFLADGFEWRTPPLWGIGYTEEVSGEQAYLHDGRAQTIEEAILWHGGEAQKSRESFTALSKQQRDALLAFLASL